MDSNYDISFSDDDLAIVSEWPARPQNTPFTFHGPSTSGSGTDFGSSSTRSVTDSGLTNSSTRRKCTKLSLKYRNTLPAATNSPKRPMVVDLAPDTDDFDPDNFIVLTSDHPNYESIDTNNNQVEFRRDSTGELLIQSGQSITKKKKHVTFAISDDETDDEIDDDLDSLSIAQRIKKMRRKKMTKSTPVTENSEIPRKGKNLI